MNHTQKTRMVTLAVQSTVSKIDIRGAGGKEPHPEKRGVYRKSNNMTEGVWIRQSVLVK